MSRDTDSSRITYYVIMLFVISALHILTYYSPDTIYGVYIQSVKAGLIARAKLIYPILEAAAITAIIVIRRYPSGS